MPPVRRDTPRKIGDSGRASVSRSLRAGGEHSKANEDLRRRWRDGWILRRADGARHFVERLRLRQLDRPCRAGPEIAGRPKKKGPALPGRLDDPGGFFLLLRRSIDAHACVERPTVTIARSRGSRLRPVVPSRSIGRAVRRAATEVLRRTGDVVGRDERVLIACSQRRRVVLLSELLPTDCPSDGALELWPGAICLRAPSRPTSRADRPSKRSRFVRGPAARYPRSRRSQAGGDRKVVRSDKLP